MNLDKLSPDHKIDLQTQYENLLDAIKRDCSDYLHSDVAFFRKLHAAFVGPKIFHRIVRQNRQPLDTSIEDHITFNWLLERKFHIKRLREKVLFVYNGDDFIRMVPANIVYVIFPKNNSKYVYAHGINDSIGMTEHCYKKLRFLIVNATDTIFTEDELKSFGIKLDHLVVSRGIAATAELSELLNEDSRPEFKELILKSIDSVIANMDYFDRYKIETHVPDDLARKTGSSGLTEVKIYADDYYAINYAYLEKMLPYIDSGWRSNEIVNKAKQVILKRE